MRKTAKEKGVDHNTANTMVKNNNLFLKCQVNQVQLAPSLGQSTALPSQTILLPSGMPSSIAGT